VSEGIGIRALALGLPILLVTPGTAHAWRCPKSLKAPPVSAALVHPYPGNSLWACDHRTGRRIRLARGRLRGVDHPLGTEIDDFDVDGRRVAWTYSRIGWRRMTIVLREAIVGRHARTVVRQTLYAGPRRKYTGATVAVSSRGDLAWSRGRVVLAPAHGRARVVARGFADAFEDRTLRWEDGHGHRHYLDVAPPPRRGGCPAREGWTRLGDSGQVLVTQAFYGSYETDGQTQVVRACLRGSGKDHVVAESGLSIDLETVDAFSVAGFDRSWVVLVNSGSTKADLDHASVLTFDAATGAKGRTAMLGLRDETGRYEYRWPEHPVVTERGVAAWITGPRLFVAGSNAGVEQLDTGVLANLRADGTRITWTNGGEPKSADPG
jgi:hypothetical protein